METIVYIFFSLHNDNRFEFGHANNVEQRLLAHNKGLSPFTKPFRPWKVLATKQMKTKGEAVTLVKELRKFKSKESMLICMLQNKFVISKE